MVRLVETSKVEHYVGFFCRFHGIGSELFHSSEVAQVLICLHPVVFSESVANVSAFVHNVKVFTESSFQSFKRSDFISCL